MDEILTQVSQLDVPPDADSGRYVEVYRVNYANPYSVYNAINQAFNTRRGIKEQDRVNAALDWDTATIMVTASKDRHDDIKKMLEDLDRESESTRAFRILELANADAAEVAQALQQIINQQRVQRGQTRPTITANPGTNSLIVYANEKEMADFSPLIESMDSEEVMGTKPQRIVVQHQNASTMADLLTRVFTEPAKTNRGRGSTQKQIPIILADDATNTLIVRAQEKDYREIADMVSDLDTEDVERPGRDACDPGGTGYRRERDGQHARADDSAGREL